MSGQDRLEERFRRLLRAYPKDHRDAHGEEMVGVLLAGAAATSTADRARPGVRDALDIVRGGLAIRARRTAAAGWGEGAAVAGLVALVLLCTLSPLGMYFLARLGVGPGSLVALAPALAWPAVLVLALAGLRRSAAALGCVALGIGVGLWPDALLLEGPWILLALLAVLALAFSPGPRPALRALGARRTLALVAGAATLGFLHTVTDTYGHVLWPAPAEPFGLMTRAWIGLAAGAALLAAGAFRLRTPGGRRATLLLAVPLGALLVFLADRAAFLGWRGIGDRDPYAVALDRFSPLATIALAAVLAGAALASARIARART